MTKFAALANRLFQAAGVVFVLVFSTWNAAWAAPAAGAAAPGRDSFGAGQWLVTGYGSAAVGKTERRLYAGHLGVGYHFADELSLNLEGAGYYIDHTNDSAAAGVDLLPRWHYLVRDDWSLYVDGGPGFIYSRRTLRDPGTHFNFTVQAGVGATYNLSSPFILMGGYRWFHISNARIRGKDRNVGFDSPMFYLGLMIPL